LKQNNFWRLRRQRATAKQPQASTLKPTAKGKTTAKYKGIKGLSVKK
jgi:hypothetical protein